MKNPQTLEALRDWLKTKPADEPYNWGHPQVCLLGQYFKHIGAVRVSDLGWQDISGNVHLFPRQFVDVALDPGVACDFINATFGAALKRAEKLIASQ